MRRVTCATPPQDDPKTKAKIEERLRQFEAYHTDPEHSPKPKFNEKLYKRFRDYLLTQFYWHCAYCETRLQGQGKGAVDHFRPKSEYWWKAYEWGNLLPSCIDCNSLYKKNAFPVRGIRARGPGETDEPLLLNPLFDDPIPELEWDIVNASPNGVTERGKTTVTFLSLDRETLNDVRKTLREEARSVVGKLLGGEGDVGEFNTPKQYFDQVMTGQHEFSAYLSAVMKREFQRREREAHEGAANIAAQFRD